MSLSKEPATTLLSAADRKLAAAKGNQYRKRNEFLFQTSDRLAWKQKFTATSTVRGGARGLTDPVVLYKAATKRVTAYSKEIYALEQTGVNRLGTYYLSKHLFNLSFTHDPYLKEPVPLKSRQSIEVLYQLGNFHRDIRGGECSGLFLRPLTIMTDKKTFSTHGWTILQRDIAGLIADLEISLPVETDTLKDDGWFYALYPFPGTQRPFVETSFVQNLFDELTVSGYLRKQHHPPDDPIYKVTTDPPKTENVFNDDWVFLFGRNTKTSETEAETKHFSQALLRDVIIQQNSSLYYGPLLMYCHGCGCEVVFGASTETMEERFDLRWYDLGSADPRTVSTAQGSHTLCYGCESGESLILI